MHLLKSQPRGLTGEAEPVDLEQSPGDIVILSAADTEIAGLAAARRALGEPFPSVRLANWMALAHPYSVDLYCEKVLARARLVVLRLLGGGSYWRYGLDETTRLARADGSSLVVLAGDPTWDAALAREGTVDERDARKLFDYFTEGGSENLTDALRFCAHLIGGCDAPPAARPLPSAGIYRPALATSGQSPTAAIVFYRALVQAGQTEPVDALCRALTERGMQPLPVFVSSLKAKEDAAFVAGLFAERAPALVLNATAFAVSQPGAEFPGTVLDGGRRPVLQVTFSASSEDAWAGSTRGLSPTDLTMNVALPEIDGRMITRAVSFKEAGELDPLTECRPVRYRPRPDRVAFVAELAARWARLATRENRHKRVAIVLANYPNRDGRLANGVGLDAPASTAALLSAMRRAGYDCSGAPETGAALMDLLLAGPTNARRTRSAQTLSRRERVAAEQPGEGLRRSRLSSNAVTPHPPPSGAPSPYGRRLASAAAVTLSPDEYRRHFDHLPEAVRAAVSARWGAPESDPFFDAGRFVLPAHRFGNIVIAIQPARGYNIDPKATYHDPDLVPPHGYFAFYIWLREAFRADALVQMGKHGNLEWLPGKALALSEKCFPEAALGPLPLIYPFIVNDPGEGAQAKRRAAAIVVDHLMPPMSRAESYGAAAEIESLIDEYAAAQAADPRRATLLAGRISDLAAAHGFDRDLRLDRGDFSEAALARLDEHICDLKELQIRDGLHVLGGGPRGRGRAETLVALARLPRGGGGEHEASLLRALADDLGLGFDPLDCAFAKTWEGPRPEALGGTSLGDAAAAWRTYGDTVERLEALALELVAGLPGS